MRARYKESARINGAVCTPRAGAKFERQEVLAVRVGRHRDAELLEHGGVGHGGLGGGGAARKSAHALAHRDGEHRRALKRPARHVVRRLAHEAVDAAGDVASHAERAERDGAPHSLRYARLRAVARLGVGVDEPDTDQAPRVGQRASRARARVRCLRPQRWRSQQHGVSAKGGTEGSAGGGVGGGADTGGGGSEGRLRLVGEETVGRDDEAVARAKSARLR
eukprot:6205232-Pleurochrysis_carterae.AAC.5